MAPAPSFRGHQWTYRPVRGSCLLLLLVMSNLLLCQGNPCPSCSPDEFDTFLQNVTDLFIDASWLSHDFHNHSTIMFKEFNEDLSKWTLMLLYSWNSPLCHLVTELKSMKELSEAFLSSAIEIENMSEKLQAFIGSQFRKITVPVLQTMHEVPSTWSGLPSLKSSDEDRCHSELYNLFHCLHRDSRKVDTYIKILACRTRGTC
uniref:Uncharacterized protein n=1 Tax=Ovis aries TaxID=9940 RepID=A0AC11EME9_SHEEP